MALHSEFREVDLSSLGENHILNPKQVICVILIVYIYKKKKTNRK